MKNLLRKSPAFQGMLLFFFLFSILLPQFDCHTENGLRIIGHIHPISTNVEHRDCCELHTNNHSHNEDHPDFLSEDVIAARTKNRLWDSDPKQTDAYPTPNIPIAYELALFTVHAESKPFQQGLKHSFSGLSPPVV